MGDYVIPFVVCMACWAFGILIGYLIGKLKSCGVPYKKKVSK